MPNMCGVIKICSHTHTYLHTNVRMCICLILYLGISLRLVSDKRLIQQLTDWCVAPSVCLSALPQWICSDCLFLFYTLFVFVFVIFIVCFCVLWAHKSNLSGLSHVNPFVAANNDIRSGSNTHVCFYKAASIVL